VIEGKDTLDEIEIIFVEVVINALETEDEVELEENDDLEYDEINLDMNIQNEEMVDAECIALSTVGAVNTHHDELVAIQQVVNDATLQNIVEQVETLDPVVVDALELY
jgi:hypothetical protein